MLGTLLLLFLIAVGIVALIAVLFGIALLLDRRATKRWETGHRPKLPVYDPAYD